MCPQPISSYVYIDDFNTIERIRTVNAAAHVTTQRKEIRALAAKSERQFSRVIEMADSIGMRVNEQKTQILYIHGSDHSNITSYIRTSDGEMSSAETQTLLPLIASQMQPIT